MGRGRYWIERLTEDADLGTQPLPGQPIVEIAGDHRVLIENHLGVKEYGTQRITVKVKYGCVCICGEHLELMRMTREQLVICGRIDCVTVQRRA